MHWFRRIFLLIGLLILIVIIGNLAVKDKQKGSNQPQSTQQSTKLQDSTVDKMTSAQHLNEAKQKLSEEDTVEAKKHIAVIQPSDSQYKEAQKLLIKVNRKEKELQKKGENLFYSALADQRKELADKIEKVFLGQGMDVYVKVSGKQNEILTIKYILMTRAKAYQFMNYEDFYDRLKTVGYKRVIFSDGETSWTYKME